MKAEFLVMTVLAWVGVLFLIMKNRAGNSERNVFVLLYAFVIVGCFGIFLSKGINDPLGRVYVFLFEKVPGFRLFRDPTKFYALSAIAFSLLIPFGIEQISKYVTSKRIIYARIQTNYLYYGLVSLFTVYLLFLIHPVYLRNLSGTLGIKSLPEEYVKLKNFIVSDSSFSRILFIPQIHRLSFYSQEHPAVSYGYLFNTATAEQALASLYNQKSDEFKKILQERSIKYVVVPYDVYQEMFVSDGVYDITLRNKLLDRLNQMPWLTKNTDFKNITVYKVDDPKEKFWNVPLKAIGEASIHYKNITPSQYQINVNFQGENQLLIFSEGFHHSWRLLSTDYIVYSKPYNGLNSFKINKSGKYVIEFEPQKYVTDGAILSLITLCVMGIVVGIYVYKLRSIFIDNR